MLVALAMGAGEVSVFGRRGEALETLTTLDPRVTIGSESGEFDLLLECTGGDDISRTEALIGRLIPASP